MEVASISNLLHYVAVDVPFDPPEHLKHCTWVDINEDIVYTRFYADFGPLNLSQIYKFCQKLDFIMKTERELIVYSSTHCHIQTNAVLLLVLYGVVSLKLTPIEATKPFQELQSLIPFRDAAYGICTYMITILDCAKALQRGIICKLWSYTDFNCTEYDELSRLENGDINWIVPGKILAFSGPLPQRRQFDHNLSTCNVDDYVKVFKRLNVTCVIRFNEECYDRKKFLQHNINHFDLVYPDGGNPTDMIMNKFINVCERERGGVAVHCKAGLGRTGTNIGAYMMKHYQFTASEVIAWCRLCRPGSIVGPQQYFLKTKENEQWLENAANVLLQRTSNTAKTNTSKSPLKSKFNAITSSRVMTSDSSKQAIMSLNTCKSKNVRLQKLHSLPHQKNQQLNLQDSLHAISNNTAPKSPTRLEKLNQREGLKYHVQTQLI